MAEGTQQRSGVAGWLVAAVLGVVVLGQFVSNKASGSGASPIGGQRFVQVGSLHCRGGPSKSEPIVRSMPQNTAVQVLEEQSGWSFVEGQPSCWAASEYLGNEPLAELASGSENGTGHASGLLSSFQPRVAPEPEPDYIPEPEPEPEPVRQSFAETAYYPNCSAARAAGAAPVRRGDPGYSSRLDRDNDGVGCE